MHTFIICIGAVLAFVAMFWILLTNKIRSGRGILAVVVPIAIIALFGAFADPLRDDYGKYTWEGYKGLKEQMEYAGQKMMEATKRNDTGMAQAWADKYTKYERDFKEYSEKYWQQENQKKQTEGAK